MTKPIRPEVEQFMALAQLPDSRAADGRSIQQLSEALERITPPLTDEEASRLLLAFGPDDCFGLAWARSSA
jgi:hypothetical protein